MTNIVVPMAGAGSRFARAGYAVPKYLVEFRGKTLLEYSLESLPLRQADNLLFVALAEHVERYRLHSVIDGMLAGYPFEIVTIPEITRGQAETVMACREQIDNGDDLLIFNIDTHYRSGMQARMLAGEIERHDGFLGSGNMPGDRWSFARTDEAGFVVETAEKRRISGNALTGLYHFRRGSDFVSVASEHIARANVDGTELYIAPMYNDLIRMGRRFVLDPVEAFIPLGTPEDIALALAGADPK